VQTRKQALSDMNTLAGLKQKRSDETKATFFSPNKLPGRKVRELLKISLGEQLVQLRPPYFPVMPLTMQAQKRSHKGISDSRNRAK